MDQWKTEESPPVDSSQNMHILQLNNTTISTYPSAQAKLKKWISNDEFPENWFKFGIILNDFWSSTFWDSQNRLAFT